MTAKRDFKRIVRERMVKTGESYTRARQILVKESLARIDKLLADYANTEGDRIEREHLIIEAANLAITIHASAMATGAFQKVFWIIPVAKRLEALEDFLIQDDLTTKDLTWAFEQRLIYMAMAAMHNKGQSCDNVVKAHKAFFSWVRENLDEASQAAAFGTPEVWYCWDQVGLQGEILGRMKACLTSIPAQQENKHDRLFLARNLLMYAARKGNDYDVNRSQDALREIIDEPGELPATHDNGRLEWEGILQQAPLIAAGDDAAKAVIACEACAAWIRSQQGEADWLIGEIAALCLFQGHYSLAEKYATSALDAGQGKNNALIYAWRAGGHLGATGNVESTVPLLREARRHLSADKINQLLDDQIPFMEYSEDQRLREVAGMHR